MPGFQPSARKTIATSSNRRCLRKGPLSAAAKRVIHTLRGWGIRIDESVFLDGADKGPFLEAFGADIFFDDQTRHVESAGRYVNAAHVAGGIANE